MKKINSIKTRFKQRSVRTLWVDREQTTIGRRACKLHAITTPLWVQLTAPLVKWRKTMAVGRPTQQCHHVQCRHWPHRRPPALKQQLRGPLPYLLRLPVAAKFSDHFRPHRSPSFASLFVCCDSRWVTKTAQFVIRNDYKTDKMFHRRFCASVLVFYVQMCDGWPLKWNSFISVLFQLCGHYISAVSI